MTAVVVANVKGMVTFESGRVCVKRGCFYLLFFGKRLLVEVVDDALRRAAQKDIVVLAL